MEHLILMFKNGEMAEFKKGESDGESGDIVDSIMYNSEMESFELKYSDGSIVGFPIRCIGSYAIQ
jgi:hypothetical protein